MKRQWLLKGTDMAGWTKKKFHGDPVTEFLPGPQLARLQASLSGAVILALDVSGSMSGDRIEKARNGCKRFIDEAVDERYQVGVILWHHGIAASTPVEKSPQRSLNLITEARTSGGNDIRPTLSAAHSALMAIPAGDRVLAIFGDGDLGVPKDVAFDAARPLIVDEIRIITCGLGDSSATQLDAISTETSDSPRVASESTIADSIASMAQGLTRRSR